MVGRSVSRYPSTTRCARLPSTGSQRPPGKPMWRSAICRGCRCDSPTSPVRGLRSDRSRPSTNDSKPDRSASAPTRCATFSICPILWRSCVWLCARTPRPAFSMSRLARVTRLQRCSTPSRRASESARASRFRSCRRMPTTSLPSCSIPRAPARPLAGRRGWAWLNRSREWCAGTKPMTCRRFTATCSLRPRKPMSGSDLTGSVLVVGGAGFVGGALVRRLLQRPPRRLIIVDNLLSADSTNLPEHPAVEFLHGSITNGEVLDGLPRRLDHVFHLACYHGNQSSIHDPLADHQNNAFTTLKLLDHLKTSGSLEKVVYAAAGCAVAAKTFDQATATPED